MNAVNLAGVRATRSGFEIDPHLRGRFSLRMARVGVARGANALRGYLRVARRERLKLRVRVPAGVDGVTAWADGRAVAQPPLGTLRDLHGAGATGTCRRLGRDLASAVRGSARAPARG